MYSLTVTSSNGDPNVQNDPLWNLRYALAGVGLALLLSVFVAALVGSALGDALGGSYGWRAGVYGALLLYVVVGAFVLFAKVARHETRPLSAQRVGLWLASLWLWPGLLLVAKRAAPQPQPAATSASPPPAASPASLASPASPDPLASPSSPASPASPVPPPEEPRH
jgi:MFS family permease